jgi:hypothetical protein
MRIVLKPGRLEYIVIAVFRGVRYKSSLQLTNIKCVLRISKINAADKLSVFPEAWNTIFN